MRVSSLTQGVTTMNGSAVDECLTTRVFLLMSVVARGRLEVDGEIHNEAKHSGWK